MRVPSPPARMTVFIQCLAQAAPASAPEDAEPRPS
jgi:hypothetical protein